MSRTHPPGCHVADVGTLVGVAEPGLGLECLMIGRVFTPEETGFDNVEVCEDVGERVADELALRTEEM